MLVNVYELFPPENQKHVAISEDQMEDSLSSGMIKG